MSFLLVNWNKETRHTGVNQVIKNYLTHTKLNGIIYYLLYTLWSAATIYKNSKYFYIEQKKTYFFIIKCFKNF